MGLVVPGAALHARNISCMFDPPAAAQGWLARCLPDEDEDIDDSMQRTMAFLVTDILSKKYLHQATTQRARHQHRASVTAGCFILVCLLIVT